MPKEPKIADTTNTNLQSKNLQGAKKNTALSDATSRVNTNVASDTLKEVNSAISKVRSGEDVKQSKTTTIATHNDSNLSIKQYEEFNKELGTLSTQYQSISHAEFFALYESAIKKRVSKKKGSLDGLHRILKICEIINSTIKELDETEAKVDNATGTNDVLNGLRSLVPCGDLTAKLIAGSITSDGKENINNKSLQLEDFTDDYKEKLRKEITALSKISSDNEKELKEGAENLRLTLLLAINSRELTSNELINKLNSQDEKERNQALDIVKKISFNCSNEERLILKNSLSSIINILKEVSNHPHTVDYLSNWFDATNEYEAIRISSKEDLEIRLSKDREGGKLGDTNLSLLKDFSLIATEADRKDIKRNLEKKSSLGFSLIDDINKKSDAASAKYIKGWLEKENSQSALDFVVSKQLDSTKVKSYLTKRENEQTRFVYNSETKSIEFNESLIGEFLRAQNEFGTSEYKIEETKEKFQSELTNLLTNFKVAYENFLSDPLNKEYESKFNAYYSRIIQRNILAATKDELLCFRIFLSEGKNIELKFNNYLLTQNSSVNEIYEAIIKSNSESLRKALYIGLASKIEKFEPKTKQESEKLEFIKRYINFDEQTLKQDLQTPEILIKNEINKIIDNLPIRYVFSTKAENISDDSTDKLLAYALRADTSDKNVLIFAIDKVFKINEFKDKIEAKKNDKLNLFVEWLEANDESKLASVKSKIENVLNEKVKNADENIKVAKKEDEIDSDTKKEEVDSDNINVANQNINKQSVQLQNLLQHYGLTTKTYLSANYSEKLYLALLFTENENDFKLLQTAIKESNYSFDNANEFARNIFDIINHDYSYCHNKKVEISKVLREKFHVVDLIIERRYSGFNVDNYKLFNNVKNLINVSSFEFEFLKRIQFNPFAPYDEIFAKPNEKVKNERIYKEFFEFETYKEARDFACRNIQVVINTQNDGILFLCKWYASLSQDERAEYAKIYKDVLSKNDIINLEKLTDVSKAKEFVASIVTDSANNYAHDIYIKFFPNGNSELYKEKAYESLKEAIIKAKLLTSNEIDKIFNEATKAYLEDDVQDILDELKGQVDASIEDIKNDVSLLRGICKHCKESQFALLCKYFSEEIKNCTDEFLKDAVNSVQSAISNTKTAKIEKQLAKEIKELKNNEQVRVLKKFGIKKELLNNTTSYIVEDKEKFLNNIINANDYEKELLADCVENFSETNIDKKFLASFTKNSQSLSLHEKANAYRFFIRLNDYCKQINGGATSKLLLTKAMLVKDWFELAENERIWLKNILKRFDDTKVQKGLQRENYLEKIGIKTNDSLCDVANKYKEILLEKSFDTLSQYSTYFNTPSGKEPNFNVPFGARLANIFKESSVSELREASDTYYNEYNLTLTFLKPSNQIQFAKEYSSATEEQKAKLKDEFNSHITKLGNSNQFALEPLKNFLDGKSTLDDFKETLALNIAQNYGKLRAAKLKHDEVTKNPSYYSNFERSIYGDFDLELFNKLNDDFSLLVDSFKDEPNFQEKLRLISDKEFIDASKILFFAHGMQEYIQTMPPKGELSEEFKVNRQRLESNFNSLLVDNEADTQYIINKLYETGYTSSYEYDREYNKQEWVKLKYYGGGASLGGGVNVRFLNEKHTEDMYASVNALNINELILARLSDKESKGILTSKLSNVKSSKLREELINIPDSILSEYQTLIDKIDETKEFEALEYTDEQKNLLSYISSFNEGNTSALEDSFKISLAYLSLNDKQKETFDSSLNSQLKTSLDKIIASSISNENLNKFLDYLAKNEVSLELNAIFSDDKDYVNNLKGKLEIVKRGIQKIVNSKDASSINIQEEYNIKHDATLVSMSKEKIYEYSYLKSRDEFLRTYIPHFLDKKRDDIYKSYKDLFLTNVGKSEAETIFNIAFQYGSSIYKSTCADVVTSDTFNLNSENSKKLILEYKRALIIKHNISVNPQNIGGVCNFYLVHVKGLCGDIQSDCENISKNRYLDKKLNLETLSLREKIQEALSYSKPASFLRLYEILTENKEQKTYDEIKRIINENGNIHQRCFICEYNGQENSSDLDILEALCNGKEIDYKQKEEVFKIYSQILANEIAKKTLSQGAKKEDLEYLYIQYDKLCEALSVSDYDFKNVVKNEFDLLLEEKIENYARSLAESRHGIKSIFDVSNIEKKYVEFKDNVINNLILLNDINDSNDIRIEALSDTINDTFNKSYDYYSSLINDAKKLTLEAREALNHKNDKEVISIARKCGEHPVLKSYFDKIFYDTYDKPIVSSASLSVITDLQNVVASPFAPKKMTFSEAVRYHFSQSDANLSSIVSGLISSVSFKSDTRQEGLAKLSNVFNGEAGKGFQNATTNLFLSPNDVSAYYAKKLKDCVDNDLKGTLTSTSIQNLFSIQPTALYNLLKEINSLEPPKEYVIEYLSKNEQAIINEFGNSLDESRLNYVLKHSDIIQASYVCTLKDKMRRELQKLGVLDADKWISESVEERYGDDTQGRELFSEMALSLWQGRTQDAQAYEVLIKLVYKDVVGFCDNLEQLIFNQDGTVNFDKLDNVNKLANEHKLDLNNLILNSNFLREIAFESLSMVSNDFSQNQIETYRNYAHALLTLKRDVGDDYGFNAKVYKVDLIIENSPDKARDLAKFLATPIAIKPVKNEDGTINTDKTREKQENESKKYNRSLIDKYNEIQPSKLTFDDKINLYYGKDPKRAGRINVIKESLENVNISLASRAFLAMDGDGTDENTLSQIFNSKNAFNHELLEQISNDYEKLTSGRKLLDDIKNETSRNEKFDLTYYADANKTPASILEHSRLRLSREDALVWKAINLESKDKMNSSYNALKAFYDYNKDEIEKLDENGKYNTDKYNEFLQLATNADSQANEFRELKREYTDVAVKVVEITTGVTVVVITCGVGVSASTIAYVVAGGHAVKMGTKEGMLGSNYQSGEILNDVYSAFKDEASLFAAYGAARLSRTVTNSAFIEGFNAGAAISVTNNELNALREAANNTESSNEFVDLVNKEQSKIARDALITGLIFGVINHSMTKKANDRLESNAKKTDAKEVADAKPKNEIEGKVAKEKASDVAPVEPKVAETRLAEPKPVEIKPVEAKPIETKPVEAKPVEAIPVEPKPAEIKPTDAKVTQTNAVEAKPTQPKVVEKKYADAPKELVDGKIQKVKRDGLDDYIRMNKKNVDLLEQETGILGNKAGDGYSVKPSKPFDSKEEAQKFLAEVRELTSRQLPKDSKQWKGRLFGQKFAKISSFDESGNILAEKFVRINDTFNVFHNPFKHDPSNNEQERKEEEKKIEKKHNKKDEHTINTDESLFDFYYKPNITNNTSMVNDDYIESSKKKAKEYPSKNESDLKIKEQPQVESKEPTIAQRTFWAINKNEDLKNTLANSNDNEDAVVDIKSQDDAKVNITSSDNTVREVNEHSISSRVAQYDESSYQDNYEEVVGTKVEPTLADSPLEQVDKNEDKSQTHRNQIKSKSDNDDKKGGDDSPNDGGDVASSVVNNDSPSGDEPSGDEPGSGSITSDESTKITSKDDEKQNDEIIFDENFVLNGNNDVLTVLNEQANFLKNGLNTYTNKLYKAIKNKNIKFDDNEVVDVQDTNEDVAAQGVVNLVDDLKNLADSLKDGLDKYTNKLFKANNEDNKENVDIKFDANEAEDARDTNEAVDEQGVVNLVDDLKQQAQALKDGINSYTNKLYKAIKNNKLTNTAKAFLERDDNLGNVVDVAKEIVAGNVSFDDAKQKLSNDTLNRFNEAYGNILGNSENSDLENIIKNITGAQLKDAINAINDALHSTLTKEDADTIYNAGVEAWKNDVANLLESYNYSKVGIKAFIDTIVPIIEKQMELASQKIADKVSIDDIKGFKNENDIVAFIKNNLLSGVDPKNIEAFTQFAKIELEKKVSLVNFQEQTNSAHENEAQKGEDAATNVSITNDIYNLIKQKGIKQFLQDEAESLEKLGFSSFYIDAYIRRLATRLENIDQINNESNDVVNNNYDFYLIISNLARRVNNSKISFDDATSMAQSYVTSQIQPLYFKKLSSDSNGNDIDLINEITLKNVYDKLNEVLFEIQAANNKALSAKDVMFPTFSESNKNSKISITTKTNTYNAILNERIKGILNAQENISQYINYEDVVYANRQLGEAVKFAIIEFFASNDITVERKEFYEEIINNDSVIIKELIANALINKVIKNDEAVYQIKALRDTNSKNLANNYIFNSDDVEALLAINSTSKESMLSYVKARNEMTSLIIKDLSLEADINLVIFRDIINNRLDILTKHEGVDSKLEYELGNDSKSKNATKIFENILSVSDKLARSAVKTSSSLAKNVQYDNISDNGTVSDTRIINERLVDEKVISDIKANINKLRNILTYNNAQSETNTKDVNDIYANNQSEILKYEKLNESFNFIHFQSADMDAYIESKPSRKRKYKYNINKKLIFRSVRETINLLIMFNRLNINLSDTLQRQLAFNKITIDENNINKMFLKLYKYKLELWKNYKTKKAYDRLLKLRIYETQRVLILLLLQILTTNSNVSDDKIEEFKSFVSSIPLELKKYIRIKDILRKILAKIEKEGLKTFLDESKLNMVGKIVHN